MSFPSWSYFPRNERPPAWVDELVAIVGSAQPFIDSEAGLAETVKSDAVLARLRDGMEQVGYQVEQSKRAVDRIARPVLFGEGGKADVTYEIDAFHDGLGIAVEVEAGRGAMSNADYRDIIRMSLLLDARYMVLMMPKVYRFRSGDRMQQTHGYTQTLKVLSAIYASQRLRLPFDGVLLVGF